MLLRSEYGLALQFNKQNATQRLASAINSTVAQCDYAADLFEGIPYPSEILIRALDAMRDVV
jgi:hypothetical protein